MPVLSTNLFRCRGVIERWPYLIIGALLLMVKFATDWTVSRLVFQRSWSPAEYVAPRSSLALLLGGMDDRAFYLTMLLIALPFIFVGVSLTAMRLRSVGLSAGWTLLFFVPGVNFVLFAVLIGIPSRRESPIAPVTAQIAVPPAAHDTAAPNGTKLEIRDFA